MTSFVYDKAREKFATARLNWSAGIFKAALLSAAYAAKVDTDEFLAIVPSDAIVARSLIIPARTYARGHCSGTFAKFLAVTDTRSVTRALIYREGSSDADSDLVAFIDTESIIGVPFVPTGFDYFLLPNAVLGGFFRI